MTDFTQFEQQFAQDLITSISSVNPSRQDLTSAEDNTGNTDAHNLLNTLINNFPSYVAPAWSAAYRGALSNLAQANMPNNGIAAQPNDNGPWYAPYVSSYSYNGPCSGYRNAFFGNTAQSPVATQIAAQTQSINNAMTAAWWGNCGVTLLTDAIRQTISVSLDTDKLSADLNNIYSVFKPAVAASYLVVFSAGYSPTATALQAINQSGQTAAALQLLDNAIKTGQFTANINQAISTGGDSATAATWFLFNLWIALKALGCDNVDAAISSYQSAGLSVPPQVGPQNWWNGAYSGWFVALNGSDVVNDARNTITAAMPESESTVYPNYGGGISIPVTNNTSAGNGYSYSFCNWGSLNWYNPQSSSCFGAGTLVLMADGSSKPIETVQLNEYVQTTLGPRKVVLSESPLRNGRSLYSVNGFAFSATSAHPLLCANHDAQYCAIAPWNLIDSIPTFSSAGVTKLAPGLQLQAWADGALTHIQVDRIDELPAGNTENELVYDLILENWEKDHPAYFVGGPQQFLAVMSETIDPLHEPAASIAIITALDCVTATSREQITNPAVQIPAILQNINLHKAAQQARKQAKLYLAGKPFERPPLPNGDYYRHDDKWDPHASMLEHYMASYYGRWIRSEVRNGWRHHCSGEHADIWLLDIHDIELVNQPLQAQQQLRLMFSAVAAGFQQQNELISHQLELPASPIWCLRVDETIELGRVPERDAFVIDGTLTDEHGVVAQFHLHSYVRNQQNNSSDVFLFNPAGTVIGRIALSLRTVQPDQYKAEQQNREQWNRRHVQTYAYALGRQLGMQIQAALETNSHHC